MQSKDRLFFTRFITSKAIDAAPLRTKNIISEFTRQLTSSGRSEDSNLSSEHEKANLHQGIDFQSGQLSNYESFSSESYNDNEGSKIKEGIRESVSVNNK